MQRYESVHEDYQSEVREVLSEFWRTLGFGYFPATVENLSNDVAATINTHVDRKVAA